MIIEDVTPPLTPLLKSSLSSAVECKSPVTAKVRLNPSSFRYGCFCGVGYPIVSHPSGKSKNELTLKERDELIAEYYKIKPVDDIDKACQNHDVCLIYKGRYDQDCNDTLLQELDLITDAMDTRRGYLNTDSLEWRCEILSNDMSAFFHTIFTQGQSDSLGRQFGEVLARLINTPILLTVVGITRPLIWANKPYPLKGEKCIVQ